MGATTRGRAAPDHHHRCRLCSAGHLHCGGSSCEAQAAQGTCHFPHRATSAKAREWHLSHPLAGTGLSGHSPGGTEGFLPHTKWAQTQHGRSHISVEESFLALSLTAWKVESGWRLRTTTTTKNWSLDIQEWRNTHDSAARSLNSSEESPPGGQGKLKKPVDLMLKPAVMTPSVPKTIWTSLLFLFRDLLIQSQCPPCTWVSFPFGIE